MFEALVGLTESGIKLSQAFFFELEETWRLLNYFPTCEELDLFKASTLEFTF